MLELGAGSVTAESNESQGTKMRRCSCFYCQGNKIVYVLRSERFQITFMQ
jgi:hypothetical protein